MGFHGIDERSDVLRGAPVGGAVFLAAAQVQACRVLVCPDQQADAHCGDPAQQVGMVRGQVEWVVQVEPEPVHQVDHARAFIQVCAYLIADLAAQPEQREQSHGRGQYGLQTFHWFPLSLSTPPRCCVMVRRMSLSAGASAGCGIRLLTRCSARTRMFVSVCSLVHGESSAVGCMTAVSAGKGLSRPGAVCLSPISAAMVMRVRPWQSSMVSPPSHIAARMRPTGVPAS